MISDKQMEELKQLKELLDADILSKEEFEEKKAKIFSEKEEEKAEPEAPKAINDEPFAPAEKIEKVETVIEPEKTVTSSNTEEVHVPDVENRIKDNGSSEEPVKMEIPDYGSAVGAAPIKKKASKKTIIIAVVAAVLVLSVIVAALGGSGNEDSEDGETVTNDTEYSTEEEPEEEAVLESISAEYTGDTEKGTVLDEYNDGITVTGTYDDGTTETIYDWTVEKPKTLKAGKTATVTISYQGQSCELEVLCTSTSKKQFMKSCKEIGYNDLARNPDKYENKNIKIYGQIIQVLEGDDNNVNFRIATKASGYGNWYEDVFLVDYTYSDGESKYLEDDMVTMWGTYGGTYTYESTGGADVTVPLLYAQYIKLD